MLIIFLHFQFGFITIFVAAFPLAPMLALLNNIMEVMRSIFLPGFFNDKQLSFSLMPRNQYASKYWEIFSGKIGCLQVHHSSAEAFGAKGFSSLPFRSSSSLLVLCLFLTLTFFPTPFIKTFTFLNNYFPLHHQFSSLLLFPTVA